VLEEAASLAASAHAMLIATLGAEHPYVEVARGIAHASFEGMGDGVGAAEFAESLQE